jgi:hypothetical protein
MVNHFDMAREVAHLVDTGKSDDETVAEMLRMFPTATAADCQRAMRIGLERLDMLDEERYAAAHNLVELWFEGAPNPVIDAAIQRAQLRPSAETLFPKPDASKS